MTDPYLSAISNAADEPKINDCGCKIVIGKKRVPLTLAWEDQVPEIEYCPTHKAATEMKAALEDRPKVGNCNTPGYVRWNDAVETTLSSIA